MAIVRRSRADVDLSRIDWARLEGVDDVTIEAQIAGDEDTAPIFTPEELAGARRMTPPIPPGGVKAIRGRLGLSQEQFAARFGFSVETIRNYEQGHRQPSGPAGVLLRVIANEPDAVIRALAKAGG